MEKICEVCGKPGERHKHRIQFCVTCGKDTEHTTAAFGLPWGCTNVHPNDKTHCSRCGEKFTDDTISLTKALGAESALCKKCTEANVNISPFFHRD